MAMRRKDKSKLFFSAFLITVSSVQSYLIINILQSKEFIGQVSLSYLDPSTGAMIISAVVGIFATILLGMKTFWYKIVSLFRGKNRDRKENNETK